MKIILKIIFRFHKALGLSVGGTWTLHYTLVDMSFEQDRQETGETPCLQPWGGSGFGTEMVRDKSGPRFVGGQFSTEPRRPFISNYYRTGYF